jgi:PAS domain S-box-containing protein
MLEKPSYPDSTSSYLSLIEGIPVGVYRISPSGQILDVNKALIQIAGYPDRATLMGVNAIDAYADGEDRKRWQELMVREGVVHDFNVQLRRYDGTIIWVRDSARAVGDEQGNILYYEGIIEDITARKESEAALQRRDAILEVLAYTSQKLLLRADLKEIFAAVLTDVAPVVGVSRAYIFENRTTTDGRLCTSQCYEWVIDPQLAQSGNPDLQNVPYQDGGFGRWLETLSDGRLLHGAVKEFPESEQPILQAQNILSIAVVPIFTAGKWWGFVGFDDCFIERRWSSVELSALKSMAGVLGAAIENTRLYKSERQARERAEVIREVAQTVTASLDRNEILQRSLSQLRRVLEFETASVYIFTEGITPELIVTTGYTDKSFSVQESAHLLQESPILRQMQHDLKPVISPDVNTLPGWIWVPGARHVHSFMAVPLVARERMLGALMIDSGEPDFFTDMDLQMAQALAQHITLAVANATLFEAVERNLAEQTALLAASTAVSSSLDLSTLLTRLARHMVEALSVTSVYISGLDPEKGTITVLAEYYSEAASPAERVSHLGVIYTLAADFGVPNRYQRADAVVHTDDPDLTELEREHLVAFGAQSILTTSLIVRDQVIGYAEMWESRYQREFSQRELHLATAITQQAAIAFENARLFESQRAQLRLAETLQAVGALLTTTLQLEELCEHLFDLLAHVIDYDSASIQLFDENDELFLLAGRGFNDFEEARQRTRTLSCRELLDRWHSQRVIVLPDTQTADQWVLTPEVADIRSWIGAALFVKGRLAGVLNVNSTQNNAYGDRTGETVLAFANQAAIAIENARLFEAAQRNLAEQSALLEASMAVSSSLDLKTVLARLAEQMGRAIGVTSVYISDWNEQTCLSTVLAEYYAPEASARERISDLGTTYHEVNDFQDDLLWLKDQRTLVLYVDDPDLPESLRDHFLEYDGQAVLQVPVVVKGSVVGYAELWESRYKRIFTEAEIALSKGIAQQTAVAIENARLYQAEAQRRREAETLHELAGYLTSTLELDDVLGRAVDAVQHYMLGIHNCAISIADDSGNFLQTRVSWFDRPDREPLLPMTQMVPISKSYASRRAWESGEPITISDFSTLDLNPDQAAFIERTRLSSLLYVPLLVHGQPIGILHINNWETPRHFQPEEIAFCQGVASQAAIAIENARLFAAERRQLHLSQTLQQVGALLTSQLSLSEVFDQILDLLAQVVSYDSVCIQLVEGERSYMAAGRGFPDFELTKEIVSQIAAPLLHQRWQDESQTAIVMPDTHSDTRWDIRLGNEYIRSWIGAALRVKGRLLGILNVDSRTVNAYNDNTAETVVAFANQAAVAIENARLYEETRQRANELAILHQVALATAAVVNVDELIRQTTELIAATLYQDVFGFVLVDKVSGKLTPHPSFHGIPAAAFATPIPYETSITGFVARAGQPRLVRDVSQEHLYFQLVPLTRSEVAVPLTLKNRVIGVINVESPWANSFSDNDIRFLTTLAGQVALAFERAQLYESLRQYTAHLAQEVNLRTVELRAERDRNQAVLDSAGEGIFFTDSAGIILYVNPAVTNLTGYTAAETLGQTPRIWYSPQPGSSVIDRHEQMWAAILAGRNWTGELVNRRKDGSTYDANLTIAPIRNSLGELTGFVGIQSDISRLKEVDRLKSKFVSNVSHELRTPLTNIRTYVTLLERGKPERRAYYLAVLQHETERLTGLIQDLLDLSRLETEATPVQLQPTNLQTITQETLNSFTAKAEAKQIDLRLQIPPDLPLVMAEPYRLEQLFTNLVGNALAYSPSQSRIIVQAGSGAKEHRPMVWVRVMDNGPGIPPEDIPRLFERFFRGQLSQDNNIPGTGLGLSICKEIIDRHGGAIEVESEPGKGSVFTVWLVTAV